MNKKVGVFVFCLLIILISIIFNASAQNLQEQVGNTIGKIEGTQEEIDRIKYDYLGEQWKKLFLENPFVARADILFTKLNFLFVLLFARDYSFSLLMLFAFMVWLFTFLSLPGYFVFLENENYKWLASLAGTVLLAYLQIFNFVANGMQKLLLYKFSLGWKIAMWIVIIAGLAIYLYLNKYFAGIVKRAREANKKRGLETRVKKIEKYQEGLKKGSNA